MTIQKPDFNQIFASQAPDIDRPPVFNNYNGGWGDESRPNNGKPTIKGFNFIQQLNDNKFLWMAQNGAFPYDPKIEYNVGIVTLKDGRFKQWNGTNWINFGQDDNALKSANNLSELTNKATARTNLGVYSKSEALSKDNNLSELADKAVARTNLDVYSKAETDAKLAGDELLYMPIPYPKSTPPAGYLAMMGQAISQATYPKLFALYGSKLPDMRAYSIRGLDNGRGVDVDRVVLSEQGDAIREITGYFGQHADSHVGGVFLRKKQHSNCENIGGGGGWSKDSVEFKASNVVPTASENRVKNISFLYIVKAG